MFCELVVLSLSYLSPKKRNKQARVDKKRHNKWANMKNILKWDKKIKGGKKF